MRRITLKPVFLFLSALTVLSLHAQVVSLVGLRSLNHAGAFHGLKSDATGNLYTLFDANDGVRLLKFNADGTQLLAQTKLGQAGDVGVALDIDSLGFIAVAGTSASNGSVAGTSRTAFPRRADSTTNSFVARFAPTLTLQWLSFVGSGRTAVTSIAASTTAVFVTGGIFAPTLPVTPGGIQQAPAPNSNGNGFVESFNAATGTLNYATYLSGANGDTLPAAITADEAGNTYIAGTTSATGFPTTAALVPVLRYAGPFAVSGFVTKLSPAGDGFIFSTFVPGSGLTSAALDAGDALLLSGNISSGLFPLTIAQTPIAATLQYQSTIRLAVDGSRVLSSTLLAPAGSSVIAAGRSVIAGGSANNTWVFASSTGTPPLLPLLPLETIGNAYAFRIAGSGKVDRNARVGGVAVNNTSSASVPVTVGGVAVASDGKVTLAGALVPTVSSDLLSTQSYDVPLVQAPNAALTSTVRDALPLAACSGSACSGGAGLLARLAPDASTPQLALSVDDHPDLTLRNLGTADATGVQVAADGYVVASGCGSTLVAGAECTLALTGAGAGSVTVQAANVTPFTTDLPATSRVPQPLTITPRELDFGIVTAASSRATRVLTVRNQSGTAQSFASQRIDNNASAYAVTQTTTCASAGDSVTLSVPARGTCTITLSVIPSASSGADGPVAATWQVGSNDVTITGYAQAAATSLSATTVDFGRQFVNGIRSSRYLYLSNASDTAQAHAKVVSTNPVFTIGDECSAAMQPHSVCRIALNYLSASAPSSDALSLTVNGYQVTVLGETLPQPTIASATTNPNLSLSATAVTFPDPVTVTTISTVVRQITLSNTGASPFTLSLALTGDFSYATNCPGALPGGSSCTVSITFTPSAAGTRQGLLSVSAGSAGPAYVALSGTGSAVLPENNGVAFGDIPLNTPAVLWLKVQQALVSATVSSVDPAFRVTLVEDIGYGHGAPTASSFVSTVTGSCLNCWLGIQFIPVAVGTDVATITLASSSGGKATSVVVSGRGVPLTGLILTPLVEDFGPVPMHSTSAATVFQLTNATSAAITTTAASVSGDFSVTGENTGAADCRSAILAPGAACLLPVRFAPAGIGTRSGEITVQTSAGTASATLIGTGAEDPGISVTPGELRFNNVPGTSATQQTITLTNTATPAETIGTPVTSDSHFTVSSGCSTLIAGASCILTVDYAPTDSLSNGTLTIPVTSAPAGAAATAYYVVALSSLYTSETAGLQIVPGEHTTVNFGAQPTGTLSAPRTLHVNNLSAQAMKLNVTAPREFAVTSSACSEVAPNGSCDLSVQFTPITTGATTGTVFLQGTPSDGSAIRNGLGYLEGYGRGAGAFSVTGNLDITGVLRFGQVGSGQSTSQTLTLTNPATASAGMITVRRVLSEAPYLTTTTCGQSLAPGQSCTVRVTYAPTYQVVRGTDLATPRMDTSSMTIQSDAASAPQQVNLAGQVAPVTSSAPSNGEPLQTLNVSQGSLTFGTTSVGSASAAQIVQMENTGTAAVHVLDVMAPAGFAATTDCATVQPSGTCSISISFQPQAAGTTLGALEISSDSVSSLEFVSLLGTGAAGSVALSPQSIDLGRVLLGRTSAGTATLRNTGSAPVTITGIFIAGTDFGLAASTTAADPCTANGALAAGASCTIALVFAPTSAGTERATLSVATSATALPLKVALSGVGTQPELVVNPASLAFGNVAVGDTAALSLTLRNVSALAVNGLGFVTTPGFTVSSSCGLTTLIAGSSCAVTVAFHPTAAGSASGGLTIMSDDPASPIVVHLTGNGVGATPLPVGGFTLTVNGGSSGSATVQQGVGATYSLLVTPVNGFIGTVALTCAPDSAAQYAACSPVAVYCHAGFRGTGLDRHHQYRDGDCPGAACVRPADGAGVPAACRTAGVCPATAACHRVVGDLGRSGGLVRLREWRRPAHPVHACRHLHIPSHGVVHHWSRGGAGRNADAGGHSALGRQAGLNWPMTTCSAISMPKPCSAGTCVGRETSRRRRRIPMSDRIWPPIPVCRNVWIWSLLAGRVVSRCSTMRGGVVVRSMPKPRLPLCRYTRAPRFCSPMSLRAVSTPWRQSQPSWQKTPPARQCVWTRTSGGSTPPASDTSPMTSARWLSPSSTSLV